MHILAFVCIYILTSQIEGNFEKELLSFFRAFERCQILLLRGVSITGVLLQSDIIIDLNCLPTQKFVVKLKNV